jgi:hypothetical protein
MTNLRGTFHHRRLTVERFAVQRRARRTNGSLMLLRFPCGGIVCNGLFDSLEADHRLQTSTLIPDMRTSYRCPFQVASIV